MEKSPWSSQTLDLMLSESSKKKFNSVGKILILLLTVNSISC